MNRTNLGVFLEVEDPSPGSLLLRPFVLSSSDAGEATGATRVGLFFLTAAEATVALTFVGADDFV